VITSATRKLVWARADGRCEACGVDVTGAPHALHHRRPKRMGGDHRPYTDLPCNLVLLCGRGNAEGCHGWAHGTGLQPAFAGSARFAAGRVSRGFYLTAHEDPARGRIRLADNRLVWLSVSGGYERGQPADPPEPPIVHPPRKAPTRPTPAQVRAGCERYLRDRMPGVYKVIAEGGAP
jgi:hypothetical protein